MAKRPKPKQRRTDWAALRDEFIRGNESITALAERHKIDPSNTRRIAAQQKWLALRAAQRIDVIVATENAQQLNSSATAVQQQYNEQAATADDLRTGAHARHLQGARALQTLATREFGRIGRLMKGNDSAVLDPELALKFFEAGAKLERQIVLDASDNIPLELAKIALLELLQLARESINEDAHASFIEKVAKNVKITRLLN